GGRHPRRFGGEMMIRAEELSANKQIALISFAATNLDKKDFMGKSDPYLTLSRANTDGTFSVVHKTEVIKNTLTPQWRAFNIKVQQLCGGDYERNIKVDCYDWDENSAHDLIGSFTTNLRRLSAGPSQQNLYECINADKKKRKGKSYQNSGVVKLNSISITQETTFLDYIRGGTQMHFAVAVDYTASNGDPRDPRSLHFLDYSGRPNQYEIALRSVGEVIKSYDTQGLYPSYGFGAKLPTGQVSHLFPLNNNMSYPYCRGIDEIISCYKSTLSTITLHGPTNFAPIINNTASIASRFQDGKHYFVLLIITDGVISDMNETLDAIVNASSLCLSIIIIGVGNADFTSMDFLDGDGNTIVSHGKRALRDIVQFVPLNRYVSGDWQQNQFELGRAVLAEIPTQFMQFMQSRGYKPGAAGQGAGVGIFPEPTGKESAPIYPSIPSQPPSAPTAHHQSYPQPAPSAPGSYPSNPSYPSGPTTNPTAPSAPGSYPNPSYPTPPSAYPPSGPNQYPSSGYPPSAPNPYPPSSGPNPYPPSGPNPYPPSGANPYAPSSAYPPSGPNPYPAPGSQYPPASGYPPSGPNPYPPTGAYPPTSGYPGAPNAGPGGPNPYPPSSGYPSAPTNSSYPAPTSYRPNYPPY
ncbi:unnamed protein product, partial [Medioppia subpectinata]